MVYDYYNYKKATFTCEHCGWQGKGIKTTQGEGFAELFELDCPNCHKVIGVISFPTTEEVLEKGSKADKKGVLGRKRFLKKWEDSKLKDINQLPDLHYDFIAFVLKEEKIKGEYYVVITHYTQVIWKEILAYEYFERFIELGKLLKQKYGDKMVDLVPDVMPIWLWGDDFSASEKIEKFRRGLKWPHKEPKRRFPLKP